MHILFLTDNFPPETNAPASRTHEHTKRWAAAGHRVTVVTTAPNFPAGKIFEGYRNRLWQRERIDGVEVIRLWTYITANEGFLRRTLDYVSFMVVAILATPFLPRSDVIVSTSPQFFTPCAAYVVSRLKRLPWVFELRDLWPDSIVAVGAMKETLLIRALRKLEYFLYRKATRIVSVTQSFREILSKNGIDAGKIEVVPNGADLEAYRPGERSGKLAEKFACEGKFVAAYVGTIGLAHGLGTLLDAAEQLRERGDIAFVIVGAGAEEKTLMAEVVRRGLDNVHFAGSVSKAEVREYWRFCDVAMVLLRDSPLFRHVLPSKMFEAMSTERPIILGVKGESEAVLKESGAGISIPPEDSGALAAAILRLAADREERIAMGKAGREFVTSRFNRDVLATRMLDVLGRVARKQGVVQ
ncbi:MAG: glycosyltransferase family 4 protein [Proteobacteria bacterium]|nr:glycosyltransferase family 4 protein [Pseudomonadota bacterium]